MSLSEAKVLAAASQSRYPHSGSETIIIQPHNDQESHRDLENLAQWCHQFSPLVSIDFTPFRECIFVDVTGCQKMFSGISQLVTKLLTALYSRHYCVRAALAPGISAAWAFANFGKLSQTINGSDQICWDVIPRQEQRYRLRALPIQALRLSGKHIQILNELGIFSLEQLESLSRENLVSHFGSQILKRWNQISGTIPEVFVPETFSTSFQVHKVLDLPVNDLNTLLPVLESSLEILIALLAEYHRGIQQLQCRFFHENTPSCFFSIGLITPTLLKQKVMELLSLRLNDLEISDPVTAVHLQATQTTRLRHYQTTLFENTSALLSRKHLSTLIDQLNQRLGPERVLQTSWTPNPAPEHTTCYTPVLNHSWHSDRAFSAPNPNLAHPSHSCATHRPLRLCPHPLPITIIESGTGGTPLCIEINDQIHTLTHQWGPERIETCDWRNRHSPSQIQRDYYRVENMRGHRFWIFHCRKNTNWFLHGWFD